ncbi:MAG: 50S ribosomal protein L25 [Planctomycetota bacterium]
MPEELKVEIRDQHGKRRNRRLRESGSIPAVLYGHGQESMSLAIPADQLETALRHGSRLVNLAGAVSESAFIRDLQWDTFGTHVVHVDLTRVSLDETVEVELPVELRGEAPGVREGGVVNHLLHQLRIDCPAGSIPDKLVVKINNLKLNEEIKAGQLELPSGAKLLDDPEEVVVECTVPVEAPEEAEAAGPAEPEVIGAKKDEEGEGGD